MVFIKILQNQTKVYILWSPVTIILQSASWHIAVTAVPCLLVTAVISRKTSPWNIQTISSKSPSK